MFRNLFFLLAAGCLIAPAVAQTTGARTNLGVTVKRASAQSAQVAAAVTTSQYTTFDFNWNYAANLPECVSKNIACYDGFILTNTTSGAVVGTQTQIGPTVLSYNYTPAGGIAFGTTNFSLVAHGFDESGASITSTPATASITVKVTTLAGPTGLQGKAQ
jgi:hypothetical protein